MPFSPGARGPCNQRQILDDQDHAEGCYKLKQFRCTIDRAQHQNFDDYTDNADRNSGNQDGCPESK